MAGTGFNSTTGAAFLQRFYSPDYIANSIAAKASRLLKMIKRNPNCAGDTYNFFALCDEIPTGSASFGTAQAMVAANTTTLGSQFNLQWNESNEPVRLSGKIIAQTKHNNASWTTALKFAMDSGLRIAAHRLSVALYTQGWGELSQITNVSGATFQTGNTTNLQVGHSYRYFRGMQLVFALGLNTTDVRSQTALTVLGVDYSTGTITCSANLSVPGAANNDFAFTLGDRYMGASTGLQIRPLGLGTWIPVVRPVTDTTIITVGGVNRALNTRLFGNFVDATQTSIEQGATALAQICSSVGNAEKLVLVISPNNYTALSVALGSNKRFVDAEVKGTMGFRTMEIFADGIQVIVISDKYLGDDIGWMVDPGTVELNSLGPAPFIQTDDGQKLLRIADDNGVEIRIVSWTAYAVKNPAACGVLKLQ